MPYFFSFKMETIWIAVLAVLLFGGILGAMVTGGVYEDKFDICKNETYNLSQQLVDYEEYLMAYVVYDQNFRVEIHKCKRDYDKCLIYFNNENILVLAGEKYDNYTLSSTTLIWMDADWY